MRKQVLIFNNIWWFLQVEVHSLDPREESGKRLRRAFVSTYSIAFEKKSWANSLISHDFGDIQSWTSWFCQEYVYLHDFVFALIPYCICHVNQCETTHFEKKRLVQLWTSPKSWQSMQFLSKIKKSMILLPKITEISENHWVCFPKAGESLKFLSKSMENNENHLKNHESRW